MHETITVNKYKICILIGTISLFFIYNKTILSLVVVLSESVYLSMTENGVHELRKAGITAFSSLSTACRAQFGDLWTIISFWIAENPSIFLANNQSCIIKNDEIRLSYIKPIPNLLCDIDFGYIPLHDSDEITIKTQNY